MNRILSLSIIAIVLTGSSIAYFGYGQPRNASSTADASGQSEIIAGTGTVAAPGVVEAVSEEIEVGAEMPGKLKEVSVEEGDTVVKGQSIAALENSDFQTAVDTARSQIETLRSAQATARVRLLQAQTDRQRIANGSRTEERAEARAGYEQTLPDVENSRREYERRQTLFNAGDVSKEELERARTAYENAQKRSRSQLERFNVVNAGARADELAKADAAVRLAETQIREFDAQIAEAAARVRQAEANLEKTIIRSPINGVVLRKRLKGGESVSTDSPTGIVTVADTSALRVRVDLDERDVAKIKEGQRAYVTADAYGQQKFGARVIRIGQILGRKNFRTDRPTEKVDTRVLEVLLELDSGNKIPLGLRVDAFITTGN